MKVAVWGSYNHGNFGDDIMALTFAYHLQKLGATPTVYRLDYELASQYRVSTCLSLDQLLDGAAFAVMGGGGMLTSECLLRLLARRNARSFEIGFRNLHRAAQQHKCAVYPISIGGDGRRSPEGMPYWRRCFFSSAECRAATVRLRTDLALMRSLGKEAIHYPDVVLASPSVLSVPPRASHDISYRIGVNLHASISARPVSLLLELAEAHRDTTLVFLNSHLPSAHQSYEAMPSSTHNCITAHDYEDPVELLSVIRTLDLVVSSKLHIGVAALGLGVPFLSMSGKAKTRQFLSELGVPWAYFCQGEEERLLKCVQSIKENKSHTQRYDWDDVCEHIERSRMHLTSVEAIMQHH